MASSPRLLLLLFSLLSFLSLSTPKTLVLPVKKDQATLQYVTRVSSRTPPTLLNLVVDLGGRDVWVDCDSKYVSSSYRPVRCDAPQCSLVETPFGCGECFSPPRPGCSNRSCGVSPEGPTVSTNGELAQDVFAFLSTTDGGSNPGPVVRTRDYIFSCAPRFLLKGLARGAQGMAGLGRNRVAMPIQLAVEFQLRPKFAMCLSSAASSQGAIFFGDGPYKFLPNVDASASLIYTPLFINRVSTAGSYVKGEKSVEHFIGVKSSKINGKVVPVNATLLSIDKHGDGGTKISTMTPYTTLETSIYEAATDAFAAAMSGKIRRVAPVAPFRLCYSMNGIGSTHVGPAVPTIDLVLQNESVYWRIFGANSMAEAKTGILCLAFVDGGVNPRTSIVIGGHQLEDNLLQFDLGSRSLGFTSSLLFRQTTCANFNFTAKP